MPAVGAVRTLHDDGASCRPGRTCSTCSRHARNVSCMRPRCNRRAPAKVAVMSMSCDGEEVSPPKAKARIKPWGTRETKSEIPHHLCDFYRLYRPNSVFTVPSNLYRSVHAQYMCSSLQGGLGARPACNSQIRYTLPIVLVDHVSSNPSKRKVMTSSVYTVVCLWRGWHQPSCALQPFRRAPETARRRHRPEASGGSSHPPEHTTYTSWHAIRLGALDTFLRSE